MRSFQKITVLVVSGSFAVAWAAAAPLPTPTPAAAQNAPPVDALVAEALAKAPTLAALTARVESAREKIRPAGALPDPMVELGLQDIGFPNWTVGREAMSMIGPDVRQEFPGTGKRAAQRDLATAEVAVRAADLEQGRRGLTAEVRSVYARIYAIDREAQVLGTARELLDLLQATVAVRYATAEAQSEAVIKAQLELSRLGERLDDLDADRQVAVAELNALLDRPGDAPLGKVTGLPPVDLPPAPWTDLAVVSSPQVAIRKAALEEARRRLQVARLATRPDFTAGAGVGLRGGLDPAVTLRIGLTWPLWRAQKQLPLIRSAEQEVAAAEADLREAQVAARSQAVRLAAQWQRSQRQLQRYQQAIVPQSSAAIDAARSAYLAGRGDFTTVIGDFGDWLDARVQLASREADRFRVWAVAEALLAPTVPEAANEERKR